MLFSNPVSGARPFSPIITELSNPMLLTGFVGSDKIEDTESLLIAARAKKTAIEAEKLTADNIYKVLIYFDKLYAVMDEFERRKFMESLVSEVHVYEESKPNGQWLKSIKLKLPIIEEDMEICLDNGTHVECVVKLDRI